jgi:hypothetical protein
MLLLIVMLVGSPLAGFGCQTIIPDQFQIPCETNLGATAVQSNSLQPIPTAISVITILAIICWLRPQINKPKIVYLLPPLPPPRLFV